MKIIRTLGTCLLLLASSLFASPLQEQNKAIAKRVVEEILSKGHFELADQLYEIHDEDLIDRVYSKPLKLLEGEFNSRSLHRRRL